MSEPIRSISGATKIQVVSNFFRLSQSPVDQVSIYSLTFSPEIESENRYLRRQLLTISKPDLEAHLGHFINTGNNLFSLVSTPTFSVQSTANNGTEYLVIVSPVGKISNKTQNTYKMYANSMLKLMMRRLGLKQLTMMPKFYDTDQVRDIPNYDLKVWRGYIASFSHHMNSMLLNIDFSSKIIRNQTVFDLIRSYSPTEHREINSELSGKIVMTCYGNNRCYRIERVMFDMNPRSKFTGVKYSTYADYYKACYDITISNMRQPLLEVLSEKGKNRIYLIPELCQLTGIPEEMRKDYRAMNAIAEYTRLEPSERLGVSLELSGKLANDEKCERISAEYSMRVDPAALVVDCFRFNKEKIKVGPNKADIVEIDKNNSFTLTSSLANTVPIEHWVVLAQRRDVGARDQLIRVLSTKASKLHLQLSEPNLIEFQPNTIKSIITSLDSSFQIAVVIIPPNDSRMYSDIKQACALSSGIPTQCVKSNNLMNPKKSDSILSKLLIQMSVKTGSHAWQVSPTPGIPLKTMVIGMDVFHDTVNRNRSVLAFIATIHPSFASTFNTTRFHSSGQEIAPLAGECLREALSAFFEATKKKFYPEMIVVYRDGVGDGQIEAVKSMEVQCMKNTIATIQDYFPSLVYVLVNKDTNAKFFARVPGRIENPQPGTVVMDVVVPDNKSFYLISHKVTQGMASPTLYRVIENSCGLEIETIARFAFKLCYMYYNWTGGIKVPGPTMMAHKLAYIVGQSVHGRHVEKLNTLPWFY